MGSAFFTTVQNHKTATKNHLTGIFFAVLQHLNSSSKLIKLIFLLFLPFFTKGKEETPSDDRLVFCNMFHNCPSLI